jgi:hypothetical protein
MVTVTTTQNNTAVSDRVESRGMISSPLERLSAI